MLILNDLHLSVQRKGGTTPVSQEALRGFLYGSLATLLDASPEDHLLINGDLMDGFDVATRDWLDAYLLFSPWLAKGKRLTLVAGNHDWVARGDKVSSFEALGAVLKTAYPDAVTVVGINESSTVAPGVLAIAHHANQDLFDAALEKALALAGSYHTLLLHCNLNNRFAQQSDNSLDLSDSMARKFKDIGVHILLAHEHNHRIVGNVTVLGCQWPTSIADCLDSPEKFAHTLTGSVLMKLITWSADGPKGYTQLDWRGLADYTGSHGFIRIAGGAKSSEAAEVINTISKFRQKSGALVISNAVAIDGMVQAEDLPSSFEAAKAFDVVAFVHKHLDVRETATFDKLLEQSA